MAKTREELLALLNADNGLENLKELMNTEPAPVHVRLPLTQRYANLNDSSIWKRASRSL